MQQVWNCPCTRIARQLATVQLLRRGDEGDACFHADPGRCRAPGRSRGCCANRACRAHGRRRWNIADSARRGQSRRAHSRRPKPADRRHGRTCGS